MRCLEKSNTTKLLSYQKKLAKLFISNSNINGMIALWEAGSGKTILALAILYCYISRNINNRVIVITLSSLKKRFEIELEKYIKLNKQQRNRIKVFTYNKFIQDYDNINCNKRTLIIVDEAQNLKTSTSNRTKKVLKCRSKADKILLLSATPIMNKLYDIEPLIALIDDRDIFNIKIFNMIIKNNKLFRKYFNCKINYYENDKKSLEKYFPKKREKYIPLIMNDNTRKIYNQVERNLKINRVKNFFELSTIESIDLQSFHNGLRRVQAGVNEKILLLIKYINNIQNKTPSIRIGLTKEILKTHTDKIIIFNHFNKMGTKIIIQTLKKYNIDYALIDGSVTKKKRSIITDKYINNEIKILIISAAGSTGLNLIETGYMFILTPSWTKSEQIQTIARSIRFKGHNKLKKYKRNVLIYHFVLIKKEHKNNFYKILRDDIKYEKLKIPISIDLKMIIDAKRKQIEIKKFIKKIKNINNYCNKIDDITDYI